MITCKLTNAAFAERKFYQKKKKLTDELERRTPFRFQIEVERVNVVNGRKDPNVFVNERRPPDVKVEDPFFAQSVNADRLKKILDPEQDVAEDHLPLRLHVHALHLCHRTNDHGLVIGFFIEDRIGFQRFQIESVLVKCFQEGIGM